MSVGAIQTVSASVSCTTGTQLSVTLRKGFQKRVEAQIVPTAQALNPDGTPVPAAWWDQRVFNDTLGKSIGGWASNIDMVPGLVQTNLLSSVPVGVTELTYTATRRELPSTTSLDLAAIRAQPIVETCTAHFTVIGR